MRLTHIGSLGIAGVWGRYGDILVVPPPKHPHIPSPCGDSQRPLTASEKSHLIDDIIFLAKQSKFSKK